MAACATCGTTILFGGARDGDLRFCNAQCQSRGFLVAAARQLPRDVVTQQTSAVFHGPCPKCGGQGPVDVHNAYRVWSALLLTSWRTIPQVSCRACGVKSQIGNLLFSLFLGWWGFPWGLVITPVQVGRNIAAMLKRGSETAPSPELRNNVSLLLAEKTVRGQMSPA